ncbi:sugar phosphate nucleotidyltransferase [Bacillus pacificus]|uniref:sugar phosphate nucleotidyltransferase n=1 Tax=Bacillus pacificus TaxID=2026187 RepID=UPI003D1D246B
MKVVILCGGNGTRMSELTKEIPKPLVRIGEKPLIWYIMKLYKYHGFEDFILLLGYKGEKIKEYFVGYNWRNHSFHLDSSTGYMNYLDKPEKWNITFLDTGLDTMTGARLKKAQQLIGNETFMLTYGDGLSNINLKHLLKFHLDNGVIATVTGIYPDSPYGTLLVKDGIAESFDEKNKTEDIINGGYFVLNPQVFQYLSDKSDCIFERDPLMNLAQNRELAVFHHQGFWRAVDTFKDVVEVNEMWKKGNHLWEVW